MESSASSLPCATLSAIVTLVVIQHIDDLIRGPLALQEESHETDKDSMNIMLTASNPILALLSASVQLRQTTLQILSDILDIPLSQEGLWRLESNPWTKLAAVRRYRADASRATPFTEDETAIIDECGGSSVLRTYVVLPMVVRAMELPLHTTEHAPGPSQDTDTRVRKALQDTIVGLAGCPAPFQELARADVDWLMARSAMFMAYDQPFLEAKRLWRVYTACSSFAFRFDSNVQLPPGLLEDLMNTIRKTQDDDAALESTAQSYTHFIISLGVERMSRWHTLLDVVSATRGDDLEEIHSVVREFRDVFSRRLKDLGHDVPPTADGFDIAASYAELSHSDLRGYSLDHGRIYPTDLDKAPV